MTPDFAEFLQDAPSTARHGKVFNITGLWTGWQLTARRAGRIVSEFGKKAGIVVNEDEGKFASAHDLRRAFGPRWAKRIKSFELKTLMRHESIETTERHYIELEADELADELWAAFARVDEQTVEHDRGQRRIRI